VLPYIHNRVYKKYIPDALITYIDGRRELIEIKLSLDTQYKKNLAKFKSAEVFAKENNIYFRVIGAHGSTNWGNYTDWNNLADELEIEDINWKSAGNMVETYVFHNNSSSYSEKKVDIEINESNVVSNKTERALENDKNINEIKIRRKKKLLKKKKVNFRFRHRRTKRYLS
jgi:hypothetical protein